MSAFSSKSVLVFLGLGLVILFVVQVRQWIENYRIVRWKKSLNLQQHMTVFEKLFTAVDGFMLSRKARQKHDAPEYVYGEIDFTSFVALLSLVNPDKETVFYDLGSGTGKAVIACALVFPIHKAVGIELFSELHHCATLQKKRLSEEPQYSLAASKIEFIHGDFLHADLDAANLIFINATALFQPTWGILCARLLSLKHVKTIITTSKPLVSAQFNVTQYTKIQMSWGVVVAFIHTRMNK
jgi:precorrin-6B methylase 2